MAAIESANDRQLTGNFVQTARPTQRGIVDSLAGILRRCDVPFADDALASRLDLLLLPFLRDIPTAQERVTRLQQALTLASGRLSRDYEIVYRHIFLKPAHSVVTDRRKAALEELQEHPSLSERQTVGTVKGLEQRMLQTLANILLDPEFEQQLDDEHPRPSEPATSSITAQHAFKMLSANVSVEINSEDYRKCVVRQLRRLETSVPDQRVAMIRFRSLSSDPMPVARIA